MSDFFISRDLMFERIAIWREKGETIAFTNGVFDMLHRGHVHSLERAAEFADRLIVGVNSDSSVRRLNKGSGRPLNKEEDRAALIAALRVVDAVVLFDETTPRELISGIRPDVLVKGADYKIEEIAGREFAGRVELVEMMSGYSTSSLVRRIVDLNEE